ncbi:MAG: AAA family ATPase, partial [Thermomicrobiales bacterium]
MADPLPLDHPPTLPHMRTSLVGREVEIATARDLLLETAAPLLTLTGLGGVGKTRLAIAIARDVAQSFADGVVYVDLAALADSVPLPAAVADALQLGWRAADASVEAIATHLRARQLLLVLDNCEHLLSAAAELTVPLLAACPAV